MTVFPRSGPPAPPTLPTLMQRLLAEGIPPSLLIDLLDVEGMRVALAAELTPTDVALAPAPPSSGAVTRTVARTA